MNIKTLSNSWQRSWGAMFKSRLGDTALAFIYPHAAPRKFHTFFCPPLHIIALDAKGETVFDQIIQPRSFVRIPPSRIVLELDPDSEEMPSRAELLHLLSMSSDLPRGAIDESVGLGTLFFAILAQAVSDIRRVRDANCLSDSGIDPALLEQRFSAWERGSIANSAGFIVNFGNKQPLPWKAILLSQQVLSAEQQHIEELYAASVAGIPWKHTFGNVCMRCDRPGSWRPVVSPPLGVPVESAWRYQRPENSIPLCNKCAYRLSHRKHDSLLDMVWGLWGPRFEAFWQWHQAVTQGHIPSDWDRQTYPLWPRQYGGETWAAGSGAWQHADPQGPKNVSRNETHWEALARALAPVGKVRHLVTSPPLTLAELEETGVFPQVGNGFALSRTPQKARH